MYHEGDLVDAVVEEIIPSGVFVCLKDDCRAFIRRQELTLSGDISPREVAEVGKTFRAVVTKMPTERHLMELSVRDALPNPWNSTAKQLQKMNGVVIVTVKRIYRGYLLVQLEPGVDGLIPWEELPDWMRDRPGEYFWEGDRVEVEVTYFSPENRILRFSIKRRIENAELVERVIEKLGGTGKGRGGAPVVEEEKLLRGPIPLAGPVLIVEEHEGMRQSLANWLVGMGCSVQAYASLAKALEYTKDVRPSVGLIGLSLPGASDFALIDKLRERLMHFPVAITSDSGNINAHLREIDALDLSAVFVKPLDIEDLYNFLMAVSQGNPPRFTVELRSEESKTGGNTFEPADGSQFSEVIDNFIIGDGPLIARLQSGLQKLAEGTCAESAILFHIDPLSHKVMLVAFAGSIPLNTNALYRLIGSPVKDIIVENRRIFENHVLPDHEKEYQNLLAFLPFNSVIGVPMSVWGKFEDALFLFHREERAFTQVHQHDAMSTAMLISSALERQKLVESLRSVSALLLSGEMIMLLNHEVFNPLSTAILTFLDLKTKLAELEENPVRAKRIGAIQEMRKDVPVISSELNRMQAATEQFRQLEATVYEPEVDLNRIIDQIARMVSLLAKRADAVIKTNLATELPMARITSSIPNHVFLNVMLNAIQHMEGCPKKTRVLTISTLLDECGDTIQVRFKDTGPGIHQALWKEIFTMGFTTRKGGSGLGLFISRMLLDTASSRISVEDSTIAGGSTFLIEIPAKK